MVVIDLGVVSSASLLTMEYRAKLELVGQSQHLRQDTYGLEGNTLDFAI